MATCFATEPTVFFVGGQGTKAGHATPGGATLDWFEEKGTSSAGFDLSDIMDANGGPINNLGAWQLWTAATKVMTRFAPANFNGAEIGMIAYLADPVTGHITTGRYKITAITTSGDTVTSITFADMLIGIDYDGTNIATATVCIGGAFASMNAAIGSSSPLLATSYDVHVHDNLDEAAMAEIVLGVTGALSVNSALRYWGFNESPGDRMPGGLYEGTWTSKVAGANTLLDPDARDNIMFYCIFFQNDDVNDGTIEPGTSTDEMNGWLFQHCKIEDIQGDGSIHYGIWNPLLCYDTIFKNVGSASIVPSSSGTGTICGSITLIDCYFELNRPTTAGTAATNDDHFLIFVNCKTDSNAYGTYGFNNGGDFGTIILNCSNMFADNPPGQNSTITRLNDSKGWVAIIRSLVNLTDSNDDQMLAWIRQDNGGTLATVADCNAYPDATGVAAPYLCQRHLDAVSPAAIYEINNWWWQNENYCRQIENDLDTDGHTQNRILKRGADENLAIGTQLPLNFSNPLFGGTVVR